MVHSTHIAAMAGAGTGKTYSLVENYLTALFGLDGAEKKRPHQILALTFTDKAATEMRLRITARLLDLIRNRDPNDALILDAERKNITLPSPEEMRLLSRGLPNAPIATFHGFCAQLLRQEHGEIGIDDSFRIISPVEEQTLARSVMRPIILAAALERPLVKSLIARFRLGATGTSFGLIDGLLDAYAKLAEKNIDCASLYEITKNLECRREQLDRDLSLINNAFDNFLRTSPTKSTHARLMEIGKLISCIDLDADEAGLAKTFVELRKAVRGNFGDAGARRQLVGAIVSLGARLVDHVCFHDQCAASELLVEFHDAFTAYKRNTSVMSYGDLLIVVNQALRENLSLRQRVKERIHHVLVDEYQDTSPLQQDIIALLCEDKGRAAPLARGTRAIDEVSLASGPSLFIVGDSKQSIYGFRGAEVQLFEEMRNTMEKHAGVHFSKRILRTNRRSSVAIIELVNLVARHTLAAQGYHEQEALVAHTEDVGRCGLWVLNDDEELDKTTANLTAGVYGIVELLTTRPDLSPGDIVVLTRRIKSASFIKRELHNFGIPARIVGGEGFFQQQEVVDLLSALKLINDPADAEATAVVLRSPLVLLSDHELMLTALRPEGFSLASALLCGEDGSLSTKSYERAQRFSRTLADVQKALITEGLPRALDILIDGVDFAYSIGLYAEAEQKWANIEKLRALMSHQHGNPFCAIEELYQNINSHHKEPLASGRIKNDAVTIMTIHQSKGLEFKVVILVDTESSLPPQHRDFLIECGLAIKPKNRAISACAPNGVDKDIKRTLHDQFGELIELREQMEMPRLLYVALTRAKQELYIASSNTSFSREKNEKSLLSLFLRPYRQVKEEFTKVCAIKFLERPTVLATAITSQDSKEGVHKIFSSTRHTSRIFASSLSVEQGTTIQQLIINQSRSFVRNIDGNLAHKLLSIACPALMANNITISAIDTLIASFLRAQGFCHDDNAETANAVRLTMHALFPHVQHAEHVMSEMPLCAWPSSDVMIEGFADLVLINHDYVGVIEFKSSMKSVHDPDTYAQTLAYAHALESQFALPIKFAVVLVGATKLVWQNYDEKCRAAFMDECLPRKLREKNN